MTAQSAAASVNTIPTNSKFSDTNAGGDGAAKPSPPSPTASESDQGHGLHRSASNRSNRSDFYASNSTASMTSLASSASTTSSGRRMIIPLYNLHAHNVMTNTILDAGTDARVAKFHKRGLEVIGLGILEPSEVWIARGDQEAFHAITRTASRNSLLPPQHQQQASNSGQQAGPGTSSSRAATPETSQSPGSSRLSLSSDTHGDVTAMMAATPTATPTGAKKLFGKIFKKKDARGNNLLQPIESNASALNVPPTVVIQPNSPTKSISSFHGPPALTLQPTESIVLPAVLGLTPTLCPGSTYSNQGRCASIVWVMKKWLKSENEGLIAGMIGKMAREASAHGIGNRGEGLGREWEVRFEWTRGKSKSAKDKMKRRSSIFAAGAVGMTQKTGSATPSRRNSTTLGEEDGVPVIVESPRQSLDVRKTRRHSRDAGAHSDDDESRTEHEEGYDSDPEDSETPWTCNLVVVHIPQSVPTPTTATPFNRHSRTSSTSQSHSHLAPLSEPVTSPAPTRLKIATLSPAPHHPKVVCQLRIPFPLPDVEVTRGAICKRVVLPDGSTRTTIGQSSNGDPLGPVGLTLTAEEIKDVICSTACWLVVREAIGGVGKVSRKGDGWRIRG